MSDLATTVRAELMRAAKGTLADATADNMLFPALTVAPQDCCQILAIGAGMTFGWLGAQNVGRIERAFAGLFAQHNQVGAVALGVHGGYVYFRRD